MARQAKARQKKICRAQMCMTTRRKWHLFCPAHERMWQRGFVFFVKLPGSTNDLFFYGA